MADPITVSGTAVGIASLGIQICQGLVQYYSSWRSCSDDVKSTYEYIASFERTLLLLGEEIQRRKPPANIVNQVASCIKACDGGIERLKKKLDKIQGTSPNASTVTMAQNQLHFQRQRLLYPFRESTLAKLREIISELRDNLLAAATTLNIDLATSSLERLEIIDERTENLVSESSLIRETVTSISRQGNEILRSESDAMYQRACEWLSPPNPFIEYTRAINEHHPGTGSWFLDNEQFLNWTRSSNSFYWIFGKPGCGKTVLSALIIRHLKECILTAEKALMGFFFFNTNDKPKTKVDKLLRSLTLQIISQKPGGQKELVDLYRKHLSGQEDPKPAMLVEYLAKQISEFKVYLVLDALDECAEARDIMWVIESIHDHGGVRLLCTSRDEEQLKEALHPFVDFKMDLDNHYLRADLKRYIVEKVDSDDELCQWPLNVREEIVGSLTEGADGMFRWVALQLQQLGECYTLDGLRKTLRSLPRGLEKTYFRILSETPETNRTAIIRLCYWMISAEVPLDLLAAAEVIKLDIDDEQFYSEDRRLRSPRAILRLCPSLITSTRKDSDGPSVVECVVFSHASVKEFLVSAQLEATGPREFHISSTDAALYVAETSVAYLSHVSKARSATTEDWYWHTFKKYPLLEYARLFWDTHARRSQKEDTTRLTDLVVDYFSSDLVHDLSRLFRQSNLPAARFPPLLLMAQFGLTEGVVLLLKNGMDVNTTVPGNWTPLSVAVASERWETVQTLIEHGASVHCNAGDHMSVYGLAIRMAVGLAESSDMSASREIAVTLQGKGSKLNPAEGRHIWQNAMDDEDAGAVRELLRLQVGCPFELGNGYPPLHYAVSHFLRHYNELLKEKGSATLLAADMRSSSEKIQHLVDNGFSVNDLDQRLRTPLHVVLHEAVVGLRTYEKNAVVGVCRLLVEFGAVVDAEDMDGWSPLHLAAAFLDEVIVRTLLPATSSNLNQDNQTPLHTAVLYTNSCQVLEALLQKGVPANNVDSYGMTALDYGLREIEERPDIVECLLQYGARLDEEFLADLP